jgi:ligand-binding SRPBCC domain-containing protein
VTWQLWQFGVPLRHTSVISAYEPPVRFVDEMVRGALAAFRHEHRFQPRPDGGCTMLDSITYRVPFGPLGALADRLFVRRRLRTLLLDRNAEIVRSCESADPQR